VVFSRGGSSVTRSSGPPSARLLYEVFSERISFTEDSRASGAARDLVVQAFDLLVRNQYAEAAETCCRAIELVPTHAIAWVIRCQALEKMRRPGEAWDVLQMLLRLDDESLTRGIAELNRFPSGRAETLDSCATEMLSLISALAGDPFEAASPFAPRVAEQKPDQPISTGALLLQRPASDGRENRHLLLTLMGQRTLAQIPTKLPQVSSRARSLINQEYGSIVAERCPQDAQRAVIILCHEYHVTSQQQNIYRQMEHILVQEPSTPILLEGRAGPRNRLISVIGDRDRRIARALSLLEQEKRSASEILAQLYPEIGIIWGVDDAELLASQEAQRQAIEASLRSSEQTPAVFFQLSLELFSSLLDDLEQRAAGHLTLQLLSLRSEFWSSGSLPRYLKALAPLVKEADVNLMDDYPSAGALLKAIEMEAELDFAEVERERMALVEELAGCSEVNLTGEKARAIEQWLAAATSEEHELAAIYSNLLGAVQTEPQREAQKRRPSWFRRLWPSRLMRRDEAPGTSDSTVSTDLLPAWFERLVVLSSAFRDHRVSNAYYYARLDGLMDCLGIRVVPFAPLRRYMEYVTLADRVDVPTLAAFELPALEAELRERLASSAVEYGVARLRQELSDLIRLVQLKLRSERVQPVLKCKSSMKQWLNKVICLEAYTQSKDQAKDFPQSNSYSVPLQCASIIDDLLPIAQAFYSNAVHRSQELISKPLKGEFGQSPIMVLVCGRFHLQEILRAVCNEPQVSVVIATPFPKHRDAEGGQHRETWVLLEEEETMSSTIAP
jgi:hypothetical protein